jgi:hypothetical protein
LKPITAGWVLAAPNGEDDFRVADHPGIVVARHLCIWTLATPAILFRKVGRMAVNLKGRLQPISTCTLVRRLMQADA